MTTVTDYVRHKREIGDVAAKTKRVYPSINAAKRQSTTLQKKGSSLSVTEAPLKGFKIEKGSDT